MTDEQPAAEPVAAQETWFQKQEAEAKEKKVTITLKPRGGDSEECPGIEMERSCTDLPCFILFKVWLIAMFAISIYSFVNGSLDKLAFKYDMDGNECTGTDHPNKLFTRILPSKKISALVVTEGVPLNFGFPNYQHYSVCVVSCPAKGATIAFKPNKFYKAGSFELSGGWEYKTESYLGFCLPSYDKIETWVSQIFDEMNKELGTFSRYVNDIVYGWKIILIVGLLSLVITVGYMYILKWITKCVMFTSLFLILVVGVLVSVWNFFQMYTYPATSDDYKYAQAFGIISAVLTALYVLFLWCQWKNIMIGAEILGCAGDFVATTPEIIVTPLVSYITMIPVVILFTFTMVFLYSTGTPLYEEKAMFAVLEGGKEANWMFWIYLFGFFWIIAFLIAVQQFVTATTCALWFFTHQSSDVDKVPMSTLKALKWAFRYHIGSLAFGSFLIACTTMLKVVFEYFARQQDKIMGKDNCIWKVFKGVIRYYIWCLDACVKFISENAYIQVAINNVWFCTGAKNSFFLILKNPMIMAAMNVAGWMMSAIGKALIMGLCTWLTMILAQNQVLVSDNQRIQQPFVPAFVVCVISWAVAAFFVSIFDFAALTIMQCFLISKEANQKGGKIWAPPSLHKFLAKSGFEYDEHSSAPRKLKSNQVTVVAKDGSTSVQNTATVPME